MCTWEHEQVIQNNVFGSRWFWFFIYLINFFFFWCPLLVLLKLHPSKHLSSENIFKTSSRCPDKDKYIRASGTSLEDVFKTFSRHLEDVLQTSLRRLEGVLKTTWRRLQDICKTSCKDVFKTSSRCFQDVSSS